jgi:hypothetical protein
VVTAARSQGHRVAAVVLSEVTDPGPVSADVASPSAIVQSGWDELAERLAATPVGLLRHAADRVEPVIDWMALASE